MSRNNNGSGDTDKRSFRVQKDKAQRYVRVNIRSQDLEKGKKLMHLHYEPCHSNSLTTYLVYRVVRKHIVFICQHDSEQH